MVEPGDPLPALDRDPFWFLRHGETDWNARDLSQGNVEVPLNERGLAQAREAAELMRPLGIATLVSSPLGRARVTAEIAAAAIGRPVLVEDGLREVSFGVQEGKPMGEWFPHWVAGEFTPEGAESFAALRRRAVTTINRLLAAHARPLLIVGHGGMMRAVRAAMGLEPNFRTPNGVPIFCRPPTGETAPWSLEPAG